MANPNKLETFNVKKNERFMKKKRKLEAFLELVRKDESTTLQGVKKSGGSFQANYNALKDELRKYQKKNSVDPTFHLNDSGRCAQVSFSLNDEKSNCIEPLFIDDILHLLLVSVLGNVSPFPLRWAKLEHPQNISKTVLIEIEELSKSNVIELHSKLNQNSSMFPYIVEIVSSNTSFANELSMCHLPNNVSSHGKENYSSIFPMDETTEMEKEKSSSLNNISRLHLLLSPIQLAMEHYPLPQSVFEQSKSKGYCFSKDKYSPVHDDSPMFAVDCEMCRTSSKQAVTRVAIVNENLETVYHTLVKPKEQIIDYVTKFSGVTEKMLRNVTTTLKDVQNDIRNILPSDAILCGQSLNSDLHALEMIHPYCIDTSVIFNQTGIRQKKTSLKQLAHIHLKENIQGGKNGHSPIEDSLATMKLVLLKLQKFVGYGDAVLSESTKNDDVCMDESDENNASSTNSEACNYSDLVKLNPNFLTVNPDSNNNIGFFSRLSKFSKKVCLIGSENSLSNYCSEMITDNVSQVTKSKIKKILKAISDSVENNDLILSHLVSDLENCMLSDLSDELNQIYNSIPSKTLFIILMSGVDKPPKGNFFKNYCMVTLKK